MKSPFPTNTTRSRNMVRFILIDDNEIDLFFHRNLIRIRQLSDDILSFCNAQDALEYFNGFVTDVSGMPESIILLDIQMPEMDGFEFLHLFENYPHALQERCRILMVSSSLDFGDISRTHANVLVQKLLKKPLDPDELEEIVKKLGSA